MQYYDQFIIVAFTHPKTNTIFNNKKYLTQCDICNKPYGYRIKENRTHACGSCRAKERIKKYGNPMQGRKQDPTKFRVTHANVNYEDYILDKKNKRLYRTRCKECGADRSYKKHSEANRTCLKCHTARYTKKNSNQRKIYCSMKANINQRFQWRKIGKNVGIFRYLPYTLDQLMMHLESMFEPWMNWGNHGAYSKKRKTWQIDHIIADSNFVYSSTNDKGFQDSWALSNLRPLEAMANILKSNK